MKIYGFVNVYRSGFFHTPGKPGAFDRHPGDIYATHAAAVADIYPKTHYVATVPIVWEEPTVPHVNEDPKPVRPRYFGLNNPRVGVEP